MSPEELLQQKEIEFYAASIDAWCTTRIEHDKTLCTLSAGGIGLLLTLLTTTGLKSVEALYFYIVAIASFFVTLITVLLIFKLNGTHIEDVLAKKPKQRRLSHLDAVAFWSFVIGAFFSAMIGVLAAIQSYTDQREIMTSKDNKTTSPTMAHDSMHGIANLRPEMVVKSLQNIGNLQQTASSTGIASSASPTTPQATATATTAASTPASASSGNSPKP